MDHHVSIPELPDHQFPPQPGIQVHFWLRHRTPGEPKLPVIGHHDIPAAAIEVQGDRMPVFEGPGVAVEEEDEGAGGVGRGFGRAVRGAGLRGARGEEALGGFCGGGVAGRASGGILRRGLSLGGFTGWAFSPGFRDRSEPQSMETNLGLRVQPQASIGPRRASLDLDLVQGFGAEDQAVLPVEGTAEAEHQRPRVFPPLRPRYFEEEDCRVAAVDFGAVVVVVVLVAATPGGAPIGALYKYMVPPFVAR